jgi:ParB family chromosome partitioning protein
MSNRRSALGRGLGALIPRPTDEKAPTPGPLAQGGAMGETVSPYPNGGVAGADAAPELKNGDSATSRELAVDLIDPNPEQPRRSFDPDDLERLAASILQHGVLQPIVVRRAGDRYELIVGERRWRASRAAGRTTIPAVVADVADQDRLEVAIVENVQRRDLNPMELAHAYRALADAGATQEEIGRKVSMDRSSVANHLRLLELSRDLQGDVEAEQISMGHAKALLQVQDPLHRAQLRDRVVEDGLSVRATELLGRQIAGPAPGRRTSDPAARVPLDPDLARLLDELQKRFQAKVNLTGRGRKGKLEIEYFDPEDLERITHLLLEGL